MKTIYTGDISQQIIFPCYACPIMNALFLDFAFEMTDVYHSLDYFNEFVDNSGNIIDEIYYLGKIKEFLTQTRK